MNPASTLLFAAIAAAFAYTFYHLAKKIYGSLKGGASETGCSCCSKNCSRCNGCGKANR